MMTGSPLRKADGFDEPGARSRRLLQRPSLLKQENLMSRIITLLASLFLLSSLTACNTMAGAGQDMQDAGEAVQDAAES